jgi:hypothetical protein
MPLPTRLLDGQDESFGLKGGISIDADSGPY